jgi:hypothetical protein
VEGLRYSVPAFVMLLAIISLLYWKLQHGAKAGTGVPMEASPESLPPEP